MGRDSTINLAMQYRTIVGLCKLRLKAPLILSPVGPGLQMTGSLGGGTGWEWGEGNMNPSHF